MSVVFEGTYRVSTRDLDCYGHCRPSSVLEYLQEAATGASVAGGFTREILIRDYNVFWLLARIWYRLKMPLYWDSELKIRTWHRGNTGFMMYRDYDLYADGAYVGEAVSVWVLADIDTRRLFRVSNVEKLTTSSGGPLCKEISLSKLKVPPGLPLIEERMLRYSDTDINAHVNNSRYADFVCDAARLHEIGAGRFVSSLQLGYLKECRAGEMLHIFGQGQDGKWSIHGSDQESDARFDAYMTLSPLDKGLRAT